VITDDSEQPKSALRAIASWSFFLLVSTALNVSLIGLLSSPSHRRGVAGNREEHVVLTLPVAILRRHRALPTPHPVRRVALQSPAPVPVPAQHRVGNSAARTPAAPRHEAGRLAQQIARDQALYAKEVAALNARDRAQALPTIDPRSREASVKAYHMTFAPGAGDRGSGIITPTRSWRDRGLDCYYASYEFTYPDGAQEEAAIVWPFCYDPASDPFHQPPHLMPFPLPMPGYVLPAGTQLPPIEKSVYQHWVAGQG
jgi:hypothetical protein